jgi:ferredoxin
MTLLPTIDEYACSAHGDCVHETPEAFSLDDDVATVTGTASDDRILAAAKACPAGAITVFDEAGRQMYP